MFYLKGFIIYFGYGIWNSSERRDYNLLKTESDGSSASESESNTIEQHTISDTRT